jgi:hypothetical protein
VGGTVKQFSVEWDPDKNAISLTSGQPYVPNGSEMSAKGSGVQHPVPTTSSIYLDGVELALTAYNINDNNYFRLREVGIALDFDVTWDIPTQTILIDTSTGYTPD